MDFTNQDASRSETQFCLAKAIEFPADAPKAHYSLRYEKLARGELVDVSSFAVAVGFVCPVALSKSVWQTFVNIRQDWPIMRRNHRARERRTLEVLLAAFRAAREAGVSDTAGFNLYRLTGENERKTSGRVANKFDFVVHCGPGDLDEPVVTISLAGADESTSLAGVDEIES